MLEIVPHTDTDFISKRDKMIISQPSHRCLRLISNRKRAAKAVASEWINDLNMMSKNFVNGGVRLAAPAKVDLRGRGNRFSAGGKVWP